MRRKTIGFLLLALVVVAGITFVERGTPNAERPELAHAREEGSLYQVVLGGGAGAEAEPRESSPPGVIAGTPASTREPDPASSSPAADPPLPSELRYEVQKGDTLSGIVMDHLGSASQSLVARVKNANGITDPRMLQVGQTLVIPLQGSVRHRCDGKERLSDLALHYYGNASRTAPFRRANPGLSAADGAPLPAGTNLVVPR